MAKGMKMNIKKRSNVQVFASLSELYAKQPVSLDLGFKKEDEEYALDVQFAMLEQSGLNVLPQDDEWSAFA